MFAESKEPSQWTEYPNGKDKNKMEIDELKKRTVLTACEVAEVLNLSVSHVYQSIARGDIASLKIGRRVVIPARPLIEKLGLSGVSDPTLGGNCGD